jgi:peroxiredoxin
MATYTALTPGDPAPWFYQRSFGNPRYAFDTAAGRYIVLCFFGSARDAHAKAAIAAVQSRPDVFNDEVACFFGVSQDSEDETKKRVADKYPGYRYFWDFDGLIGRLYGALPREADSHTVPVRRFWVVLDPSLRVVRIVPFETDQSDIAELLACVDALPPVAGYVGFELQAPVLVLPNVFEPEFCRLLIGLYEKHGGEESGFMREVNGQTIGVNDHSHKRRKDYTIDDQQLIAETQTRFMRRVVPMLHRAYQFKATRMERYMVSCYAAEDQAHFRAHRDNTTKGTAHRRFAVSVNLNSDFEGGEVSFPEFGPRRFKPPVGGAVVFSCSMLHAVSKVTRGRRFAFLPFLYDDEAAKLREANIKFVGDGSGSYRSDASSAPASNSR